MIPWSSLVPLVAIALWAATSEPAAAQTLLRLAPLETYVDHSGSDTVGQQLAYQVREILARSKIYPLAQTSDRADVVIHLATMDLDDPAAPGRASAVAFALTYDFQAILNRPEAIKQLRFVNNGVLLVGRQKVLEIAGSIVSQVDASMRSMK